MYDPKAYDSLPSLAVASKFANEAAMRNLFGPVRDLFLEEKVQEIFGICLLHRHFSMKETQRLVEYHHSSSPWDAGDTTTTTVAKYEGYIAPRSIRWFDGKAVPYEFAFVDRVQAVPFHGEFQDKLFQLLCRHQLEHVFGLRHLEDRDAQLSVEVTEGKTNIMIPRGSISDDKLYDALWIFGLEDNDRCNCREYCLKLSEGHDMSHGCG